MPRPGARSRRDARSHRTSAASRSRSCARSTTVVPPLAISPDRALPEDCTAMTEPTNPTTHETMTRALADWVTTNHLPGLAVQVSHGDQVVFEYMHGRRGDTGHNDADTLFGVASVSKSLTAVAVMLLHQQGQLDVEDPIAKWLPQLQFAGDAHNRITIEHLLRHTSGLPGLSIVDGARTRSIPAAP